MYEKLDKLRADLERAKQRRAEADARVKAIEEKLRTAEGNQILADVGALKLTPEQVAQFLQLASSGQLPQMVATNQPVNIAEEKEAYEYHFNMEESEDLEDDEN